MSFISPILIGLAAGISSGMFGIGGGIIIVPLIVFTYGFSQQMATATSLTALLLPTGALALWQYYQAGQLNWNSMKIGFIISAGMFIGGFFGARIANSLQSETLSKIFSVFLLIIAIRLWISAK